MELIPLQIKTNCALNDEGLYEHMRLALQRNLPLIGEHPAHDGRAVLVASGPSAKGYVDRIREEREAGAAIIAINGAHDWLISVGIIPDYALTVDPTEKHWDCFKRKNAAVIYMIASQCHPKLFDHLEDCNVFLWHLYIREGQTYPPDSLLVTGGTTSGLRAINLFYSIGFRDFTLYGYDSCLSEGKLRLDGTDNGDKIVEIVVAGEKFLTTPPMAAQANEFQNLFACMPDIEIRSFGRGIITTILEERMCAFS